MKYFIFSIISIFTLLIITSSCSEDLPIAANFSETAVVYGILDQSEDVHYIKINRAFIGPGDATQIAKVPDSCYFKNVEAVITETAGLKRTWYLEDTVIENKNTDGVFYAPEQKVYFFSTKNQAPLNPDSEYKLTITIDKGLPSEFVVSGKTELVSGVYCQEINSLKLSMKGINPDEYVSKTLNVKPGNSAIINAKLDFAVNEFIDTQYDSILVPMDINELAVNGSNSLSFSISGENFYQTLANGVTKNSNITKRNLSGVYITLVGGASDLYNYILANKPTSSLSQNKPVFTNLTATNNKKVIGVFSSRNTVKYFLKFYDPLIQYYTLMDDRSKKELNSGKYTTYEHKFCSQSPFDNNKSFFCD